MGMAGARAPVHTVGDMRRLLPVVGLVLSAWGALPLQRTADLPGALADLTEPVDGDLGRRADRDGPMPALAPPPAFEIPAPHSVAIPPAQPAPASVHATFPVLAVAPKTSPPGPA